jgi:hypothetical protein
MLDHGGHRQRRRKLLGGEDQVHILADGQAWEFRTQEADAGPGSTDIEQQPCDRRATRIKQCDVEIGNVANGDPIL